MTRPAAWTDFAREVNYLVEMDLDQCGRSFGTAPCAATGTPCYYSWPTCKNQTNFLQGAYTWKFSQNTGPLLPGYYNLLLDMETYETRIKPDEALTVVGTLRVLLSDSSPLFWSTPGKAAAAQNAETDGTFLCNLKARNPNYKGRAVRVYRGLRSWAPADYELYFAGIIDNWETTDKGATITLKDNLKKLEVQYPPAQSSDNVLTAVYNGGAVMNVTDAGAFVDPAAAGGVATVKIDDSTAPEYVDYTGIDEDAQQLTGCVAGRYGTRSVSHVKNLKIGNVYIAAQNDSGLTTWDAVTGLPADEFFLNLLCNLGRISGLATAFTTPGVTVTADAGTTLTVSDGTLLPDHGFLKIGTEILGYKANAGNVLSTLTRALYGTVTATHAAATPVYLSQFSEQVGSWLNGCLYRDRWEKPTALKDMVKALKISTFAHVWQGSDSLIHFKAAPVALYNTAPTVLTDASHLVGNKTSKNDQEDLRRTGIVAYYAPTEVDAAEDPKKWLEVVAHVNFNIESELYLNEERREAFYCRCIYRQSEALLMAAHQLMRRQYGMPALKFILDAKDAQYYDVGDFCRATTKKVRGITGAPRPAVTYEVMFKKAVKGNDVQFEYEAWDVTGGEDGARYPVIAPASVTADYDAVSAEDRERYGFISDANNQVGAAKDRGYSIS